LTLAFLRDASWLTRRRIRDYATMLIVASLAVIIWLLAGHGLRDPSGRPIGTDFVSFWTVSWALHNDHLAVIYVPAALAEWEQTVAGAGTAFYAWLYPPIALLIVYPLALLPYLWSLAAWLVIGLAGYLSALWRILPRPLALWAGLAFPAVLITIEHGQNAFLTTGLAAWALLLLVPRPVLSGILLGFLLFKPQLGLLFPVALVAGGHWRAVIAAGLTAIGLATLTILCFGAEIWLDYVAVTPLARDVLDLGLVPLYKMQSIYAAARLVGATSITAYGAQGAAALGAAIFVAWAWHRRGDQGLKSAALLTAVPMATPFFLDYDLMLLAPAVAWLASTSLRDGPLPWERLVLVAVCVDPLVSRVLALHSHLLLAPLPVIALLIVIAIRIHNGIDASLPLAAAGVERRNAQAGTAWLTLR
jgi:alpha-1,2-mannosyltransferase